MTEIGSKVDAAVAWVTAEFGDDIVHGRDHKRSAHSISVRTGGVQLLLILSHEFLADHSPEEVTGLLTRWRAAEALRQAGAGECVIVTTAGIRTEQR